MPNLQHPPEMNSLNSSSDISCGWGDAYVVSESEPGCVVQTLSTRLLHDTQVRCEVRGHIGRHTSHYAHVRHVSMHDSTPQHTTILRQGCLWDRLLLCAHLHGGLVVHSQHCWPHCVLPCSPLPPQRPLAARRQRWQGHHRPCPRKWGGDGVRP